MEESVQGQNSDDTTVVPVVEVEAASKASLPNGNLPPTSDDPQEKPEVSHTSSVEAIRKKLAVAGLRDQSGTANTPLKLAHRRSRSLGEVTFAAPLTVVKPKNEVPQNQLKKAASGKALLKGLVLSCVSLNEEKPGHGEPVQQSLMREIENKFREQIELKKRQLQQQQQEREQEPQPVCHKKSEEVVAKSQELKLVVVTIKESLNPLPVAGENANTSAACKVVPVESVVQKQEPNKGESETVAGETPSPIIDQSPGNDQNNKRNSICSSSSGVELRKRYSPVYERTKKMVRQSSGSINRCSTSQQKVDVALATKTNGPSSPSASLDTEGTAPVLSPVASKGELENVADAQINDVEERSIGTQGGESVKQSKDEWLGDSSVPSSHQNVKMSSSSQVGFDRSTNTLKRGASFKGIRKNIKKTFSTQIPALTLEKADKDDNNVPTVVVCCVETLRQKELLKTEGIYRSSPSQLEVRKVIKNARKKLYDNVRAVDDPVVLAGTIKSFFFNLKHHIISQDVMEKHFPKQCLLRSMSEREYVSRLKGVVADLDPLQYDSLAYIIKHLQEVASYSKYNLMSPANLGVVWAPCIFTNCDKTMSGADLLSFMGDQTRIMELLIVHADELFDRYEIDEIVIAFDGCSENGQTTLNKHPMWNSFGNSRENILADKERQKLLRNHSLELGDGLYGGHDEMPRWNYNLQNSATVPAIGCAQSDGTIPKSKIRKMKRARSKAVCVVS